MGRGPPIYPNDVRPQAVPTRTSAYSSTRGAPQYQMVMFIYLSQGEAKLTSLQQALEEGAPEVAIAFVFRCFHFPMVVTYASQTLALAFH